MRDKEKRSRALAWIVTRWAGQVKPRVIILENVEEFQDWGPLVGPKDNLRPDPKRRGKTFRNWVKSLERHGYQVEWKELRACDYGAPTIRKRLFVIARCDGQPIVWPVKTHGPGTKRPYRTAAECIDWTIPIPSIFDRKKPLAENTLRRIARGVMRYVVNNPSPFIIPLTHHGKRRAHPLDEPLPTVTGARRGELALVAAFMAQHNAGHYTGDGRKVDDPLSTVTGRGSQQGLVSASLVKLRGTSSDGDVGEPLHTISAGGTHHGLVAAFLQKYYGTDQDPRIDYSLVTVNIEGIPHVITDIGMRMLQPRELYLAQGFPGSYIIDRGADGRTLTKTEQVRMCGNAVCPPIAAALARANAPEMIARKEAA